MSGLLPQLEVNFVSSIGRLLCAFIVLVEAANSYGFVGDSCRQSTLWAIVANINVTYFKPIRVVESRDKMCIIRLLE